MTLKDIEIFSNKDDIRELFRSAFVADNHVMATNRITLISVPMNLIKEEVTTSYDLPKDFNYHKIMSTTRKVFVSDIEETLAKIPTEDEIIYGETYEDDCDECNGSGTVTFIYHGMDGDDYELDGDCPICGGSGIRNDYLEEIKTGRQIPQHGSLVQFDETYFNARYIFNIIEFLKKHGFNEIDMCIEDISIKMRTANDIVITLKGSLHDSTNYIVKFC